jgi:hypothetical protein
MIVVLLALTLSAYGQKSADNPPGVLLHGGQTGSLRVFLTGQDGKPAVHGAPFLQVVQRAISDNYPLLMRHNGRVVVGDQSPAPMLFYPHSGKSSVVGNCVAFILPIHC